MILFGNHITDDVEIVWSRSLVDPHGACGLYSGDVLQSTGMPHGVGRMVYDDDGCTYEGDWHHGRWHGFGTFNRVSGDSYEGEYQLDQRHGHGTYWWSDGRVYNGEFSEGKRHGLGILKWPDGSTYKGWFTNGTRDGHGRYTFSDGGYYDGHWKNGQYDGFGGTSSGVIQVLHFCSWS
jgi:hypothetical protein